MEFLHKRVVAPIMGLLQDGTTPEQIANALAWGVYGGVFPVPGITSAACALFVWLFGLNIVAVMVANFAVTPLNLATFIPYIRLGEWIFGQPTTPISMAPFQEAPLEALRVFWRSLVCGLVAWVLSMPVVVLPLRFLLTIIMRAVDARVRGGAKKDDGPP